MVDIVGRTENDILRGSFGSDTISGGNLCIDRRDIILKSREFQLRQDELATRSQIDVIGVYQVQIDKNLTDDRAEYNVFLSDHERGLLAEIAQTETELKEVEER